jgi:hypothetical protein
MEQTYEKIAKGLSQHVKNIKDPNSWPVQKPSPKDSHLP